MATAKKTAARKSPAKKTAVRQSASGFSAAERAAMMERAAEVRAEGRGGRKKAADAEALLEKLAELSGKERDLAERVHSIITTAAPDLDPKTWYGMPAYARDGKIVCFLQPASKFDSRYATLGFNDPANLDDGTMWPTAYAITDLTKADEKRIAALVKQAVS